MAFDPVKFLQEAQPVAASGSQFDPIAFLGEDKKTPIETLRRFGRTDEQEAAAQQFIADSQRTPFQKLLTGAITGGTALATPFVSIAKGVGQTPELLNKPETILPTLGEFSRRAGMDIVNLGKAALTSPAMIPGAIGPMLVKQLSDLASQTPSEVEVDAYLQSLPMEQALAEERQKVAFEGANPTFAEGLTQALEMAPPVKGLQALKGAGSLVKAAPERILRAAIKPPKQLGAKLEVATANTLPEIFNANPNADKLGSMPIEGFNQTVSNLQKATGQEIDSALTQQNVSIIAGDEIAAKLNAEADRLKKSGAPAANVEFLRGRANDMAGNVTDTDSLRTAVTSANQANGPLFTRAREAANPLLSKVETTANSIISQTGGETLNRLIESVKGPEGGRLRKKWSDLTLIANQSSDRLNQIINQAPTELQSSIIGAFTSIEGIAGLAGLLNGYATGAIPLAAAASKSWARNANKLLKDSNALVTSAYDKMRSNPPAPRQFTPAVPQPYSGPIPPTLQQANDLAMAQSVQMPSLRRTVGTGPALEQALASYPPRTLSQNEIALQMAQGGAPRISPQLVPGGMAEQLAQALGGGPVPSRMPISGITAEQMQALAKEQAMQEALRRMALEQAQTLGNF